MHGEVILPEKRPRLDARLIVDEALMIFKGTPIETINVQSANEVAICDWYSQKISEIDRNNRVPFGWLEVSDK